MKSILCFSILIFTGQLVHAANVCQDVPDGIGYKEMYNNFDGSVYFAAPTVLVKGENLALYNDASGETTFGFCASQKKVYVKSSAAKAKKAQQVALLAGNGDLKDVKDVKASGFNELVDWIICKEVKP
jgi:hypothetical protein